MPVSSVQSGYALINQSQTLAKEAASEIAQKNKENDLEFNQVERPSSQEEIRSKEDDNKEKRASSTEEALTKLNQAKTYNQAGANVVQRSNEIIGTLLDTHV